MNLRWGLNVLVNTADHLIASLNTQYTLQINKVEKFLICEGGTMEETLKMLVDVDAGQFRTRFTNLISAISTSKVFDI